jgi:tetratricopeptide (TPR) repeat protein
MKRQKLLVVTQPRRGNLSDYFDRIKSALDQQDYNKAKRIGEIALKKLPQLTYSPHDEYLLYCSLGKTYFHLTEFSRSLDIFYKAHLVASKNQFKPTDIAYALFMMGRNLVDILRLEEALKYFQRVEAYYQKYGDNIIPMDKQNRVLNFMNMLFIYLYKDETEKAEEIIEKSFPPYHEAIEQEKFLHTYYCHLKAEYLMKIKKYDLARQLFQESIKISEQSGLPRASIAAKRHIAIINLLEGKIDDTIQIAQSILNDARGIKVDYLVGDAILLLINCYRFKNMSDKANSLEKRIKSIASKLDSIWLYEKVKEYENIFREISLKDKHISNIDRKSVV